LVYKCKNFQQIAERLRAQGHSVDELDSDVGNQIFDKFIDIPPYLNQLQESIRESWSPAAHLKLVRDGFVITCFGLIIRKAEDAGADLGQHRTRNPPQPVQPPRNLDQPTVIARGHGAPPSGPSSPASARAGTTSRPRRQVARMTPSRIAWATFERGRSRIQAASRIV